MKNLVFVSLLSGVVAIELMLFSYFYFFGTHSYKKICELTQLQENIHQVITDLQEEVNQLEKKLYDFKIYPYYKEKIVREQLQMMRPDEVIYKKPY